MAEHDLIDAYLERLGAGLRGTAGEGDEVVAELRDHLLETTRRLGDGGMDARDAQLLALARLGTTDELARAYGGRRRLPRLALGAALAAAAVVMAIGAGVFAAAGPIGNDPELAARLGFEPNKLQEPSGVEIHGVPVPKNIRPDMRRVFDRIAILDG